MKNAAFIITLAMLATLATHSFAATEEKTPATESQAAAKSKQPSARQPSDRQKIRKYSRIDTNALALANNIDAIRTQMAAENKRHYEELTVLRDQLKLNVEKLKSLREEKKAEKRKKQAAARAKKAEKTTPAK